MATDTTTEKRLLLERNLARAIRSAEEAYTDGDRELEEFWREQAERLDRMLAAEVGR